MSDFTSEPGDYSLCQKVLDHLMTLVDGEVTEECTVEMTQTLLQHVRDCPPCEDTFELEKHVLGLIGAKCRGEKAPLELRQRLMVNIRKTTMLIDPADEHYDPTLRR